LTTLLAVVGLEEPPDSGGPATTLLNNGEHGRGDAGRLVKPVMWCQQHQSGDRLASAATGKPLARDDGVAHGNDIFVDLLLGACVCVIAM
jgi:hypothetical protein